MCSGDKEERLIKIIIPGPLTTVQDAGRTGYMAQGFPVCGAADADSMEIGNILVGNAPDTAVLEITLGGFAAEFLSDSVVAVTGADAPFFINGVPLERYRAYPLKKRDYIYVGPVKSGCRIYLCVSGGISTEPFMGSRSTFLKIGMGGYKGRKLMPGDMLPMGYVPKMPKKLGSRSVVPPEFSSTVTLRATVGPQDNMFSPEEIDKFFSSEYTVTPASDRMGIRLDGPFLNSLNGTDIISDGIACGSVQIPSDGKPIILCADRQTTGGYAKPVTVISADMPKAGQLVPGNKVRFVRVTQEEAYKAAIERSRYIKKLSKKLHRL
ncbi:MAG: biotin-dependent carboxyltransferase family protein [Clostridia bacterium]|nr:biotin-dependent carboxyltransferase family protein [Clostridia bacterium]